MGGKARERVAAKEIRQMPGLWQEGGKDGAVGCGGVRCTVRQRHGRTSRMALRRSGLHRQRQGGKRDDVSARCLQENGKSGRGCGMKVRGISGVCIGLCVGRV